MPGRPMSRSTMSGWKTAASWIASGPECVTRHSWPQSLMIRPRLSADDRLSSTTRMRRVWPGGFGAADGRRASRDVNGSFVIGQGHDELAPLAQSIAPGRQGPVVHQHQVAGQRQPDAEPPLRARQRVVDLGEQAEDGLDHLGSNADAVVPHPDDRPVVRDVSAWTSIRPPLVGVLHGVGQEVVQDLLEPQRVGPEPDLVLGERRRAVRAAWPAGAGGPSPASAG